jgi:mannose-6-phosphate isomerase-like protein (cupin superfamily)
MVEVKPGSSPSPAVIHSDQRRALLLDEVGGEISVRIDHDTVGAPRLVQRIIDLAPNATWSQHHDRSEDVIYVASGSGQARQGDATIDLRPGLGCLFRAGVEYTISASEPLKLVSVLAPPPDRPDADLPAAEADDSSEPFVHESEEEVISAGDDESRDFMDRYFKLMIDPRRGAHYVTQFIGFIERSKAPPHTHTYDEVIYILGGSGIVHINEAAHPISAGDSVYLPPGSVHCLENPGNEPLALLGVFCPAGSPRKRKQA